MTIKERFLKQWRKNFEDTAPPELKILQLEYDAECIANQSSNSKLLSLQDDLQHTHVRIFEIRNELKRAKFCQNWLQREFIRCRKYSSQEGDITTPSPSGSDMDEAEDTHSADTYSADTHSVDTHSVDSPFGEEEEEPLYMNLPGDGDDVVAEESDSDHDYEYLTDSLPFTPRVPPPIPQQNVNHNAASPSGDSEEVDEDTVPEQLLRTYSIDNPNITTTERLTRPTMAIPAGGTPVLPAAIIVEAQRKRFSMANLSPVDDTNGGAFSADSLSLSPSLSSCEDKDPCFGDSVDTCSIQDPGKTSGIVLELKGSPDSSTCDVPHSALNPRLSTHEVEVLSIRRMLLNGILESEKKYIRLMEELLKMQKNIKLNIQTTQPILSAENYDIIFFKIPELCEIHRQFANHMEPKLAKWSPEQTYGDSFKLLASNFGVYEEYVANYKKSMDVIKRQKQENLPFGEFAQQTVKLPTGEMVTLEAMLHSPLQRITKLTLVLDDLKQRTPKSHEDYSIFSQVHEKTKEFMVVIDMATHDVNYHIKQKRQVVKQSYLVECTEGDRKLRLVMMYSDIIVCAKETILNGMFQQRGHYECQWYMSIPELSLTPNEYSDHDEKKVIHFSDAELDKLKKEISELKALIRRETDPNMKQNKQLGKIVEKYKKQLADLEATLIIESPKLPFHLYHHQGRTYTLLMSSDYERSDWKEAILAQKRECRLAPNLTPYHIEKLMSKIKRSRNMNAVGSMLITDDSELLYGQLHITVHKATGLPVPSQLYCCVEVDAYGIFFLRAKTKISENSTSPTWEQTFDFEVDGAQKLRLLVYDYTKGLDDEMYAKGALQLERSKLSSHEQTKNIRMDRIEVAVSLRFEKQDTGLKRVMSRRKQGVFGVRLSQLTQREGSKIPSIVLRLIEEVESRGMEEMGIYRISGSSGDINSLKKAFETNQVKRIRTLLNNIDIHAVAGLLKLYFRELPEPLFTHKVYSQLVDGLALTDPDAKRECMMSLLKAIPDVNRHTIFHIFNHLRRVAVHSMKNKMSLHNLSTVFGPTLLGPAIVSSDMDVSLKNILGMSNVMSQVGILYFYLDHFSAGGAAPQKAARVMMSTDL